MFYHQILEPTLISSSQDLVDKLSIVSLKEHVPDFQRPSRKLDPEYSGQYDFLYNWTDAQNKYHNIRIEVKASIVVDNKKPYEPLHIKALSSDSTKPFDMNFQQIKTRCADVFVWIAVWRDIIRYWVLTSAEVQNNKYFSKGQHRGNIGEGQLHLNQENISEFDKYAVKSIDIKSAVIEAYIRSKRKK